MENNGLIEWKKIDSAPKDGTIVLIYANGIIEAWWNGKYWQQDITTDYHNDEAFLEDETYWAPIPWQTFE